MIELKSCPICKGNEFKEVFQAEYFRGEKEFFRIAECEDCKLWFTNPRPSDEELGVYYESEDYVSHTDKKDTLIDKVYHAVRSFAVKSKVKLINSFVSEKGKLLDFGAGTGFFLQQARKDGWKVNGVEPSAQARENAKQSHELNLMAPEEFNWSGQGVYDCITLWHVLEHLSDLKGDFQKFTNELRPGGMLLIAVPNHESLDAKIYKQHWAALDVPLHLYHFAKDNIADLARQYNLSLEAIKNMPFDSFYVSMLSEKNAKGKINYLSAFGNGLRSNLATMGKQNASSLIYILRKSK